MPPKRQLKIKKGKWDFLKHPLLVAVVAATIGLIAVYLKSSSASSTINNGITASSNSASVGGNNYGQVAGGNIVNNQTVITQPTQSVPTIEQEVNYYSRLATARQWQPPEIPPQSTDESGGVKLVTIKFGGVLTGPMPVGPDGWHYLHPFLLPSGEDFTPYIKDDRLYVKTKTMFGDAEQTVEMNDEWPTKIPDGWDRNFNANSFEIVDERKLPVFQVRYDTPNTIEIYGIFVATNGAITIAFGDSTIGQAPGLPVPEIPERKAWFKYPSKDHLGDLDSQ
ncbi:MAG TPA: hypothetical protein VMB22_01045 [Verrucomicrobiae bacterium]|nr:hypothetical protein [Verrucomicrobiae bacterium]